MRKVILTGLHGMVAPAIKKVLEAAGYHCVGWDRHFVSPFQRAQIIEYIEKIDPVAIFHLAYGPFSWSETMAKLCYEKGIKFIYISTVNVYGDVPGPYDVTAPVRPNDEYSNYKYESEKVVQTVNPNSYIIRIGWQIGDLDEKHPNNMLQYFSRMMRETGEVAASDCEYISASFVSDCASSIVEIFVTMPPGLYLVNANATMSFFELASFLARMYPSLGLKITRISNKKRNTMMFDSRVKCRAIGDESSK